METESQPESGPLTGNLEGAKPNAAPVSSPPANGGLSTRRMAAQGFAVLSGQGARAGYLAAVDQAVISLANFLATLILARNVSPTELGIYGVGFTALRLVRAFQEGLTIQPLNTFGPAMDVDEFKRYASATTLIQVGLALAFSGAAAIGGYFLTILGNDTAGPAVFALWFSFLFWQIQEYVRRSLYSRGQVFAAVINTVLANAVRLGLMFWWLSNRSLSGIAGLDAIAWGSLAALIPGLWASRSSLTIHWASLRQTWIRNWEFGRWILGGQLASWVSVEFYPVLTAGMISFAAAGAYRAIQNLVAPIHLLLRATDTFLTPRAARAYALSGLPALRRMLRLTYLTAGVPILGLLVIALLFPRPLLAFLYGDTYLEYSPGLALMALFYALWFAYWPLQTMLKAARASRPIFAANMAATAAMFTIGVWMITRWGVFGTLGGQVLNAAIVAAALWWAWRRVVQKAQ
jgi:O-antigen/teichoic acid export membrane protein